MGRQILRKERSCLSGLLCALVILWASSTYADGIGDLKGPFHKVATEWGLSIGFADNFYIGGVKEDIRFYLLSPSCGEVLTLICSQSAFPYFAKPFKQRGHNGNRVFLLFSQIVLFDNAPITFKHNNP
jgi:hypothetical protein